MKKTLSAKGDTAFSCEHDQRPIQVIFVHGRSGTGKSKVIQKALSGLNQKTFTSSSATGLCHRRQYQQRIQRQQQEEDSPQDQDKEESTAKGPEDRGGHCERCSKHYVAQGKFDLRNVNRPYTALSDAFSSLWASIVADHRYERQEAERRENESNVQDSDDVNDSSSKKTTTADSKKSGSCCGHHDAFYRVRQALGSNGPSILETLIPNISRDLAYEALLDGSISDLGLHDDNSSHHRRNKHHNNNMRAASHSAVPLEDMATATTSIDNEQAVNRRTTGDNGTPDRSSNSRSKSLGAFLIGGGGSIHDVTDHGSSVGRSNPCTGSVNSATSLGNTAVSRHKLELYLLTFIQAICGINVPRKEKNSTATTTSSSGGTESVVTMPTATVTLFLDDLQWTDNASLGLLESLLYKGTGSNNLIVICSYRDDEIGLGDKSKEFVSSDHHHDDKSKHGVDNSHPLVRLQNRMKQKAREDISHKQELTVDTTYIKVDNLSLPHIHKLVGDALRMDSSSSSTTKNDIDGLATLVYERTMGNVFFVKQFLQMLVDRELLQFQFGTLEWEWDVEAIRGATSATDSVIDILSDKMSTHLPEIDLLVLQVASCLGATFHSRICCYVLIELLNMEDTKTSNKGQNELKAPANDTSEELPPTATVAIIVESLKARVEDGFLEYVVQANGLDDYDEHGMQLRFVHDAIQDAAYGLIPKEQQSDLAYQVGKLLHHAKLDDTTSDYDDESCIHSVDLDMLAVDLLNAGREHIIEQAEILDLANLNLMVGLENMQASAFVAASKLFEVGIDLLSGQTHKWTALYYLTYPLYTNLIDAKSCCGDFAGMKQLADEFLQNTAEKPIHDKFRIYMIIVESLQAEGRSEEALDLSLEVLEKIGIRFPKGFMMKLALVPSLLKTRRLLHKHPLRELRKLPPMTDEMRIVATEFATKMGRYAYLARPDLIPLIAMWCFRQTIKYGLTRISSVSFSGWAVANLAMHDHESAFETANLAIDLSEEFQFRQAHVRIMTCSVINHWRHPYHELKPDLMLGYQYGLQSGDAISAMQCAFEYCRVGFSTGVHLDEVKADLQVYLKQSIDYKQDWNASTFKVQLQVLDNLMDEQVNEEVDGRQRLASDLVGDVLSAEEREDISNGVLNVRYFADICTLWLATHFGEHDVAKKMVKKTRDIGRVCLGLAMVWQRLLPWGITASDSRDLKSLKKAHDIAKQYASAGNVNCNHIVLILRAELMTFRKKKGNNNVKAAYDEAIIRSGRSGFRSDQGLANERAGRYFFYKLKDEDWARFYIANAYRIYLDWGATNLATRLRREYPSIFSTTGG